MDSGKKLIISGLLLILLLALGLGTLNRGNLTSGSMAAATALAPVGFNIPGTVNPVIGQQAVASNKNFSFVMTWGNEKDGAGVEVKVGGQSFSGSIPTGGTASVGNTATGVYSILASVVNTTGGIFNVTEVAPPASKTSTPTTATVAPQVSAPTTSTNTSSPVSVSVSSAALFSKFKTVTGNYGVVADDVGSMITISPSSGNASVTLPSPNSLPVGTFGIRKGNNNSAYIQISRSDGKTISGWKSFNMDMQGDYIHIGNTGSDYVIVASGQVPASGPHGQHRTPLKSSYPNGYYVHAGDRGALIRAKADTGNLAIYLPKASDMGFAEGGYRNGFQIGVMAIDLPAGNHVQINANGSSINRQSFIALDKNMEVVWLDFDSNEWFITSHYEPSGITNPP